MVEFRLYYDDIGNILCYTCEKPEGKFLVIDTQTYAECRFDLQVIDGKLVNPNKSAVLKVVPAIIGTRCAIEDNAIVVDEEYDGETINWELKVYELR